MGLHKTQCDYHRKIIMKQFKNVRLFPQTGKGYWSRKRAAPIQWVDILAQRYFVKFQKHYKKVLTMKSSFN